jgi:hypothetical protein
VDILSAVFKSAAGHHISQDQSLDSLCTHSQMARVFAWLATWTNDYLQWAQQNISDDSSQQHLQEIDAQYSSIFKFVACHLKDEISDLEQNSEEDTPSVLFYLASIFVWLLVDMTSARYALRNKDNSFSQGLRSLLEALLQYRTRTSGQKNDLLETRFAGTDHASPKRGKFVVRFSKEWWDLFFYSGRGIGLKTTKLGINILPIFFTKLNAVINL